MLARGTDGYGILSPPGFVYQCKCFQLSEKPQSKGSERKTGEPSRKSPSEELILFESRR